MSAPVLHHPGDSRVHRLPAHVKIAGAVVAVFGVVATPRAEFWAFGVCALVLTVVWALARVPPGWFARRAVIEVPFVLLAVVLPITGGGPRTEVLGVSLSVEGLLAGWNIVAKGTLGVLVSLTLAATTRPEQIVAGLRRLRVPATVTLIAGLMLRYVEVLADEARRMRRARLARGDDPRLLWQGVATARGVGALFLRAYERGERVHLAMLARGWSRNTARGTAEPLGT
ncbi:cobalt ECF transporter T component CbiQ, partial [Saccharomonospora saliphila]|uniref:cobalt ECF transporter T component CbiQ n=1 Tax=Saccharomonospora saliphila TaxID=369829 RepID=UPI00037AC633